MVIENELLPFFEWLPWALLHWLASIVILTLAVVALCFLVGAVRRGPMAAADAIYTRIAEGYVDLTRMSGRRIMALAGLAFQEAIRRRVLAAFAVFVVVLLFAVWFLDDSSPDPAKLYLDFVLSTTGGLIILLALFLSAFSLPTDIAKHTIYTIVTKPVRVSEIVLGRILGFAAIGTILLAVMGAVSYVWVVREINHSHTISEDDLRPVEQVAEEANPVEKKGRCSQIHGHRHEVLIRKDGTGQTDVVQGHWHQVRTEQVGGKSQYVIGPPLGTLTARVPIYGKLRFRDREGKESNKADNVGNEWTYRQFVEGGTPAAALWRFRGIRAEQFPDGLPLQMTLAVFRTHKGTIDQPVLGDITLINPNKPIESRPINFRSKEYAIDEHFIPRKLQDSANRPIDLFTDLVADGELEVRVRCVENAQYFGAAQPDMYLLAREARFTPNYIKGYVGIWLQMLLIAGFGVMFSTFLNGPVTMMATMAALIGGMFIKSISQLLSGETDGGLAFESLIRIMYHSPMTTEMDPGLSTTVIKGLDGIVYAGLFVVTSVLPDLPYFSSADWVKSGFDIPINNIAIHTLTALGYLLPLFVAGYFFLKSREVAK